MEVGLAVGGAFLSSALNVFFNRMTPKFPNLFQGRKGDELLLRKLKTTLLAIHAVLDDAENKETTNRDVKEWLNELRGTVYHAEDLVDEINTEALRLEVEGGEQSVTNKVSHLPDEFLNKIIPQIGEVVTSLECFVSQINVLGLERGVIKKEYSYRFPSTSLVDESDIYGRDNEREKLIHMVMSEDGNGNDVSVIPIVGMGGLGKTTLAQIVYGDKTVQNDFEERAWISVSENYDPLEITKTLVGKITRSAPGDKDDLDILQVKLKESLTEKKFFIVLDNVWNENYNDWDKLRAPLKYGRKGSVILVTTRDENVARMMQTQEMCSIDPLSYTDSWPLFKKHAFNNPLAIPEFEKIGKEIVKKCKGLPLAIKTLAGLLRSKTDVKEWDDIFRSEFWTLENKSNDVLPVLKLSYHHLPPHLKHCFAFCAMFPKNYPFDEEELVLLWMANDLLQQSNRNDESLEDRGHMYFSQLRSRSFFQKKDDGRYLMHDLINDLAQYVCGKVCVRSKDYQHNKIPSEARHFSYTSEYYNASEKFNTLAQVKGLTTFFPITSIVPSFPHHPYFHEKLTNFFLSDILLGLGRLRVLSFYNYNIKELPHSLCNLKHLRYLNLSFTHIKQLPEGICGLYNLQTLLLSHCSYLDELPMNLTNLVNLHHLDLKGTKLKKMPSHMSRLKNLQTLSCFIVDSSPGRSIEELEKLHLRGYLKIMELQNVTKWNDALKAYLRDKNHLEELVLQWSEKIDDSQIVRDILEKLQPNTSLKSLTIDGYGGTRFPNWVVDSSFCNIVSLCLTNCMNCFILPTLGHLSSLKSLTIKEFHHVAKIGEEFYGDDSLIKPFQSLMTLRIEQMFDLEEWDTPENVDFSRLEELYVIDCPELIRKLPSKLLCLKKFEISKCPRLVFSVDLISHLSSLEFLKITYMPDLKELSDGLVSFPTVERIILEDCPSLESMPHMGPSANTRELKIRNCTKLEFPKGERSESYFNSLEKLHVTNAGDSFDGISLGSFPKLQTLELYQGESLKIFPAPQDIQNPTLLRRLTIFSCNNLLSFPRGGLQAPNLEYFRVSFCKKLKSLPEQMHSLLPSLRDLWISYCPETKCFPEGGLPSSLEYLKICNCKKLMRCPRDWGLQRLPALTEFTITVGDDEYEEESFPDEWLLPSSLRVLEIWRYKKLKTLNEKGLLHLTSLQTLEINYCPNLVSLSEEGLPTSLSKLDVRSCPLLTPHLERERGKYWPIIKHIPNIVLDEELIS